MNLVVFDLPAVVSYSQVAMRYCLKDAISEVLDLPIDYNEVDWLPNCSGIVLEEFKKKAGRFPADEEYLQVQQKFNTQLKRHFLETDDSFEVRPGVQNLFEKIRKKSDWDFYLFSDFWKDDTKFILNSCGVHSKKVKLFSADDALSSSDALNRLLNKKRKYSLVHQVTLGIDFDEKVLKSNPVRLVNLGNVKEQDYFVYPKFKELFKSRDRDKALESA